MEEKMGLQKARLTLKQARNRMLMLAGAAAALVAAAPARAASYYEANAPVRMGTSGGTAPGSVDIASGAFLMQQSLTTLKGRIPVQLGWFYNSQDATNGPLGKGTSLPYDFFIAKSTADPLHPYEFITPGHRHYEFEWGLASGEMGSVYVNRRDPEMLDAELRLTGPFLDSTLLFRKTRTKMFFDSGGQLYRIEDRHGNAITITRNGSGYPTAVTQSTNRKITFSYNFYGKVASATVLYNTGFSRLWVFGYDTSNRLNRITDPNNGVEGLSWMTYTRSDGQVLPLIDTITNPRGNLVVDNDYDTSGRVTRQTHADTGAQTFAYTAAIGSSGSTTLTDPRGGATRWDYAWNLYKYGYLISQVVDSLGRTTTFTRNTPVNGNYLVTAVTDFRGRRTDLGWSTYNGLLESVTQPTVSGGTVSWTIINDSWWLRPTSITDPLNRVTSFTVSQTNGDITAATDANGKTTSYGIAANGDLTSVTNALNQTSTSTYGTNGELLTATDPMGHQTTFVSNSIPVVTQVQDANGKTAVLSYDVLDRLTAISQTLGTQTLTTFYGYDADGNRVSMTDANNHTWQWVYDSMDRLCQAKDPLLQSKQWTFDLNSNVQTVTDALGQKAEISYTTGDRPSLLTFRRADSTVESTISMSWNPTTFLLDSCSDSQFGTCSWTYDSLDRVTAQTTAAGTISYTLDDLSRRVGMTVPGQAGIGYGFDNVDNLTSVTQGTQISTFTFDAVNRLTRQTLPTGVGTEVTTDQTFDAAGYLTSLVSKRGATVIDSHTYTRNPVGLLTQENDNGTLCSYGRDDLYRLTSAVDRTGTYAWTYDNAGNRLSQTLGGATTPYTVNAANRVTAVGSTPVALDANGNVTGFGSDSYGWDVRGRLQTVTRPGYSGSFTYDPNNERAAQTVNGVSTSFLLDGSRCVSEISGATTVPVLFGAGGQAINRNGRWFTPDSRGSTSRVTDGTGNVVQTYGYGVFGQVVPSTPEANPIQFLGGMNDNNGLHYLGGSSYFSPQIGQPINGKLAQVAGGLLGKVVDFVKGVGDCAVGALEGVVTSLAAVNPITGPFVLREMATEAAKAGIALGQQLQREGWATTVVDGAANLTGQFGDYSTPRKAGRSLCNTVGLAATVVDAGGPVRTGSSGPLRVFRGVNELEANAIKAAQGAVASTKQTMPNTTRVFTEQGWPWMKQFFAQENATTPGKYTQIVEFRLRQQPPSMKQESPFSTYNVDVDDLNSVLEGFGFTPIDQFSP
jgi:YD repeat-containing protein